MKMTLGYVYILHTTACLWGYMSVRVYEDVVVDHSHCVEGGACESGVIDHSHCVEGVEGGAIVVEPLVTVG